MGWDLSGLYFYVVGLYAYLGVLAVAVGVAVVFTWLKRRAMVWTPFVTLLSLPFLWVAWYVVPIVLGAWLWLAWPRDVAKTSGTLYKPGFQVLVLIAQPAGVTVAVTVVVCLLGIGFLMISNP